MATELISENGAGGMNEADDNAILDGVKENDGDSEEEGVLLYYKFVHISEPENVKSWLFGLSASLGLLGRIRVASDGVNVTIGGKLAALKEHVAFVGSNPLFKGADFKLATSPGPVNARAAAECGFTSLSARTVKELVTLGLHPSLEPPSVLNAGRHLTAWEFHEILQNAADLSDTESQRDPIDLATRSALHRCGETMQNSLLVSEATTSVGSADEGPARTDFEKKVVVVDARNLYETRIGKFSPPEGIEVMDPTIRQYSDLPTWIDDNEHRLRHNRILMYCTGGVRCEMASAYLRSKGKGFEDVLQLSGGIQRYLEAFPNGGYFAGKNFVFDHRLAVPSSRSDIVGTCLLCSAPYDDYSSRCRCCLCRMLVLVCAKCQAGSGEELDGARYMCELCSQPRNNVTKAQPGSLIAQNYDKQTVKAEPLSGSTSDAKEEPKTRKLKILCLHGFRQSASRLKGRLNALRKKLRQRVDFVFVDAPYEVPSITLGSEVEPCSVDKAHKGDAQGGGVESVSSQTSSILHANPPSKKFAWFVKSEAFTNASDIAAAEALVQKSHHFTEDKVRDLEVRTAAAGAVESRTDRQESVAACGVDGSCQTTLAEVCTTSGEVYVASPGKYDRVPTAPQFQTQTEGWSKSLDHLKTVFTKMGPFDGVLGFSQGAAIAAALCTQRTNKDDRSRSSDVLNFRFVILCSGFWARAVRFDEVMPLSSSRELIDCPSLHVFGSSPGVDRQIESRESEELAGRFRPDCRMIVRHNRGHIIPTQPSYVEQYLKFLSQFD